jgi:hypothetical protein
MTDKELLLAMQTASQLAKQGVTIIQVSHMSVGVEIALAHGKDLDWCTRHYIYWACDCDECRSASETVKARYI